MSLFFRAAYLFGFKPWDSGVAPPELVAVVEGAGSLKAGRALDLGCGTGTNCVYMAQHGWEVTGVDFVPRAIGMARRKAESAAVSVRFIVGDVTRLPDLGIVTGIDLLFDLGCFHSIPDDGRDGYVKGVTRAARPGATMLLFGFIRSDGRSRLGPPGLTPTEISDRFSTGWQIVEATKGRPMLGADTFWYNLRRQA